MNKAILDTDIFSEVLKGIDQHVTQKAATYLAVFSPGADRTASQVFCNALALSYQSFIA